MSPQKKKEEKPAEKPENKKTSTSRISKNVSARSKKTTPAITAVEVKTESIKTTEIKAKSESKQESMKQETKPISDRGPFILGAGMLVMGVLLLADRLLNISFGQFLWPFIFIVPGAMVFFSALNTEKSSGEGLAILGGILGMLGLVLLKIYTKGFALGCQ